MNGASSKTYNGKDSSNSSGKNTLMGLVRIVSRSGKSRKEGNRNISEGQESLGYRRVAPNVAPSSLYPSSSPTAKQERIVWGRPPATSTEARTIEGIQLVDEGPSQQPGSSHPLRQVQRLSSRQRDRDRDRIHLEDDRPELQSRRSIDSLFTSMNVYVPLLPHQDHTSKQAANGPRRAVSVRVDGPKHRLGKSNSISSTPRAKPARELFSPPRQSSPFQGSASEAPDRANSGGHIDSIEEQRIREAYQGRGAVWAVARGWKRGAVATFEEAEQQTRGFPGPILRQFESVEEAIDFLKIPSQSIRSTDSSNVEKDSSTGVHFQSALLQKKTSQQHQPSTPEHQVDGAIRRTIRNPATNPFLTEVDRNMANRSLSTGSPSNGAHATISPRFLFQRPEISRKASSAENRFNNGCLLPPAVLSSNQTHQSAIIPGVAVTSVITCQDLDTCVNFYREVLGFTADSDDRYKGEVVLRHNTSQTASITLRMRTPLSPTRSSSPSKIPLSMYRSSILLNVGQSDVHQLHANISTRLLSFQTALQSLAIRRPSMTQLRIEDIETKSWGSTEFIVIDPEGNMITITGSS